METRRLLICKLCAALVALLVSCAAPPAPPPASPTPEAPAALRPSPPPATSPSPTRPAPTPTPRPRALRLWVAEEGPALAFVEALAAGFAAASGAPVEVVPRPADGLRLSVATAALLGEPPPDLIWANQEVLAGLLADGALQPVGRELGAAAVPALATAATVGGELWGVPVAAQGVLLLYFNRALLPAAPITSDELIVMARSAVTPEIAGMVMAWDEPPWLLAWMSAYGGAPTDAEGQTITLDRPETVAALGLLRELYGASADETVSFGAGQRFFARGNAAIAIDGDWSLSRYRAVSDTLELGIAPLPTVPATGRRAAAPIGGSFVMMHRSLEGEPRERAQALLDLLVDPATQRRIAVELGRLPARSELLAEQSFDDPALAAAAVQARVAPGLAPTPAVRCALFGIDVWLPSVLVGRLPQDEAATRMQREAEACLAREPEGL